MFRSYKLGEIFGVEVKVHGTLLAVLAFLLLTTLFSQGLSSAAGTMILAALVLLSVTLHELGHIGAAALFGIGTTGLTLYPIGGIARLTREARTSLEELVVALAGPAVNVILAAFGALGMVLTQTGFTGILGIFVTVNIVMAIFNLIPAYPMDGGRVFRGVLWNWFGKRKATLWAARGGQIFAALFALVGLALGHLSLLIIGVFIYFQASAEYQRAQHMQVAPGRVTIERIGTTQGHPQVGSIYSQMNQEGYQDRYDDPNRGRIVIVKTPFGFQKWEM
ncbi:MAG: site-2 protease family protein [Planctomycetota bacterium]|nr:site-2 protease family protein [Planctomycetota bacterium]